MQNYFIFLDYLELRRRIEKRLAKVNWLLLHTILFVLMIGLAFAYRSDLAYDTFSPYYFIDPTYGFGFTVWSVILLGHTLWSFSRSGASGGRRGEMIEREMRERVQNDDTYLSDNPKDLFRIHGLLDEDIQKRAGVFYSLRFFAVVNALIWLGSAVSDGLTSSFAWQFVPMMAIAFLPVLAVSAWRRSRHEGRIRKLLSSATPSQEQNIPYENERLVRLLDDGELIDYEFDDYSGKKKKREEI